MVVSANEIGGRMLVKRAMVPRVDIETPVIKERDLVRMTSL
jgi:hypothetical protein